MKKLYAELIKKSTQRFSIARFEFCQSKYNSKAKKEFGQWPNFELNITLKN